MIVSHAAQHSVLPTAPKLRAKAQSRKEQHPATFRIFFAPLRLCVKCDSLSPHAAQHSDLPPAPGNISQLRAKVTEQVFSSLCFLRSLLFRFFFAPLRVCAKC